MLGRIFTCFLRLVFVHGSAVFGHAFLLLVHAFAFHLGAATMSPAACFPRLEELVEETHVVLLLIRWGGGV